MGAKLSLIIAGALFASAPARADMMGDLYEKAKAEKTLVFYAGGPTAPYDTFVADFKKQFPGIDVVIEGGFSNVLNEKIENQMKAGKLAVDMAFFQTAQDFVAWKKRGVLLSFKPDGFEQIAPAYRDADGAYTVTKVNAITYGVNTKALAPADIPRSAQDFLKPQFSGKIITCYPADDDATLYLLYTIVQKYGWPWMEKYMANKPNLVQGHLGVARSVAAGESLATLDATSTVNEMRLAGSPVAMVFSEEDATPFFTVTAGILKDAPHPNAAKLFLDWYLDPSQQKRIGVFSPRADVPPPDGFKPLSSYKAANDYRDFVSNAAQMDDLRKRFEGFTGPVVNKGGVR